MTQKNIHVIAFNVPFPADYGGVIDVFYRLDAMFKAGVKIHLHCFEYGRSKSKELNQICETVHYYPRSKSFIHQLSNLPFIVKTRSDNQLLHNLLYDDYPIFFEGLHCCYFLNHPKLKKRKKIVRSHNVEHDYYQNLSNKTNKHKEKLFFKVEAFRLKRFESILKKASYIAAISETDKSYFEKKYGNTFLLPPSHPNNKVKIKSGIGNYILYHGNLSVQENEEAVLYLLNEIAPHISYDLIVAGKNPSKKIIQKAELLSNVELISNPSFEKMNDLLAEAQINLLPTFQATGFKLKLLNALFNGRFCIGTPELVEGTGLDQLCVITHSVDSMLSEINRLFVCEFSIDEIEKRKALLKNHSNSAVISVLLDLL